MINSQGCNYPALRDTWRRVYIATSRGSVFVLLCLTPCAVSGHTAQSSRPQSSAARSSAAHAAAVQPPALSTFPNVIPWADLGPANAMFGPLDPRRSQAEMLLTRDDVLRELGLNIRQQEQLAALDTQTTQNLQAIPRKTIADSGLLRGDGSPFHLVIDVNGQVAGSADDGADTPAVRAVAATMQQALVRARQEADKQRDIILTPAQAARLRQLEAQWRGPFLLTSEGNGTEQTKEAMKLSEAQEGRLKEAWEQLRTRMAQNEQALSSQANVFLRDYGNDASKQDGFLALTRQLWREDRKTRALMEKQALVILTPTQKRQWAAAIGKPFAFRSEDSAFGQDLPR